MAKKSTKAKKTTSPALKKIRAKFMPIGPDAQSYMRDTTASITPERCIQSKWGIICNRIVTGDIGYKSANVLFHAEETESFILESFARKIGYIFGNAEIYKDNPKAIQKNNKSIKIVGKCNVHLHGPSKNETNHETYDTMWVVTKLPYQPGHQVKVIFAYSNGLHDHYYNDLLKRRARVILDEF